MAALIGANGHGMGVLLHHSGHDLGHRPVVAEVDDFGPGGLENAPNHVYGGVVAVEQARRRDETDLVTHLISGRGPLRYRAPIGTRCIAHVEFRFM